MNIERKSLKHWCNDEQYSILITIQLAYHWCKALSQVKSAVANLKKKNKRESESKNESKPGSEKIWVQQDFSPLPLVHGWKKLERRKIFWLNNFLFGCPIFQNKSRCIPAPTPPGSEGTAPTLRQPLHTPPPFFLQNNPLLVTTLLVQIPAKTHLYPLHLSKFEIHPNLSQSPRHPV